MTYELEEIKYSNDCLNLQNTLTVEEKKNYGVRNAEKYQNMIDDGIMLGYYYNGDLVAQIGTNLEAKDSNHPYLRADNPIIQKVMDKSVVIEQGAYITSSAHRGKSLVSSLEVELSNKVSSLISNEEKLKNKNEKLLNIVKSKNKDNSSGKLIMVSGCSSKNPASALTSMKNGSEIVSITSGIKVNEYEELTSYGIANLNNVNQEIEWDNTEETRREAQTLLEKRKVIAEKDNNPLSEVWVGEVLEKGYLISKKEGKYSLRRPL